MFFPCITKLKRYPFALASQNRFIINLHKKSLFYKFNLLNSFTFSSKTTFVGDEKLLNSSSFSTNENNVRYPLSNPSIFIDSCLETNCVVDKNRPNSISFSINDKISECPFSKDPIFVDSCMVDTKSPNPISFSTYSDKNYSKDSDYLFPDASVCVDSALETTCVVDKGSPKSITFSTTDNDSDRCCTEISEYPVPESPIFVDSCLETVSVVDKSDVDKLHEIVVNTSIYRNFENDISEFNIRFTTTLVVEVLHKLRYEEKSAFRFFTWAAKQDFYSHEPQVYNEMIDILSSTKYKVKQFGILCDLLDHMKRNDKKKSVPVEVLITMLRKYTEKHLTHLRLFSKKKKINLKIHPDIDALNLLLDAFCKCCLVEDAELIFNKVKKKVTPDVHTYNILFFGWCRVMNPTKAMCILDNMIEMGLTPESFTYNTAIDTFCREGMVTEAIELLEFMNKKGSATSSPTAKTYSVVISALAKADRVDECLEYVDNMMISGCLPDVSTYKELIEGMCCNGNTKVAYKILEIMGNKGYPLDVVTYNCFLKVLCDLKHSEEALKLYGKMIVEGCKPSVHTFNMLISMFFDMGDPHGAFETWDEMGKRGCKRDTITYCLMIDGLFGCDNTKDACSLLEDVINSGMQLPYEKFNLFLQKLSEIGELEGIHRLSEHMRKFYNPAMARRFALNMKRRSMSLRGT